MSLSILIDNFDGDPNTLYSHVRGELERREIPGLQFGLVEVKRSKGLFAGKEKAPVLSVQDDDHESQIFAYSFGRSFNVCTRTKWLRDITMERRAEKTGIGRIKFLEEVRMSCFGETVDRCTRAALTIYLEQNQHPIPPNLNPKDVFYKRSSHTRS